MKGPEAREQEALFAWAEYMQTKYPELKWLYHVPNGGSRNKIEAVNLKRQGVKAGVPDLCLPVARKNYHGLYIEMKSAKGKVSEKQEEWIDALLKNGYLAIVCHSFTDASNLITQYLEGK